MAELGAHTTCGSTSKSDTFLLMISMQEMMGTVAKKVTEIEKKYDELSKAKDSSDSVCENSEKEIKSEEDNLTSILAVGQREERVGAESKTKSFPHCGR